MCVWNIKVNAELFGIQRTQYLCCVTSKINQFVGLFFNRHVAFLVHCGITHCGVTFLVVKMTEHIFAHFHMISFGSQGAMLPDGDGWKSVWILSRTVLYASSGFLSCEVDFGCIFHSG